MGNFPDFETVKAMAGLGVLPDSSEFRTFHTKTTNPDDIPEEIPDEAAIRSAISKIFEKTTK